MTYITTNTAIVIQIHTLKFCHHILLASVLLACLKETALLDNCSVLSTSKSNLSPLSKSASIFVTIISLTRATSSLTLSTLSGSPGEFFFFFRFVFASLRVPELEDCSLKRVEFSPLSLCSLSEEAAPFAELLFIELFALFISPPITGSNSELMQNGMLLELDLS